MTENTKKKQRKTHEMHRKKKSTAGNFLVKNSKKKKSQLSKMRLTQQCVTDICLLIAHNACNEHYRLFL